MGFAANARGLLRATSRGAIPRRSGEYSNESERNSARGQRNGSCHKTNRPGPSPHDVRVGPNVDGLDPNRPIHDWIRFQHLQVLPISARRNCHREYPASTGAAESGIDPYCFGDSGISCRGLAALEFSEGDGDIWEADYKVPFAGGGVGRHFDWMHRFLRCATPPWSVLGENGSWSDT